MGDHRGDTIREGTTGGASPGQGCPDPNRWLGMVFGMGTRLGFGTPLGANPAPNSRKWCRCGPSGRSRTWPTRGWRGGGRLITGRSPPTTCQSHRLRPRGQDGDRARELWQRHQARHAGVCHRRAMAAPARGPRRRGLPAGPDLPRLADIVRLEARLASRGPEAAARTDPSQIRHRSVMDPWSAVELTRPAQDKDGGLRCAFTENEERSVQVCTRHVQRRGWKPRRTAPGTQNTSLCDQSNTYVTGHMLHVAPHAKRRSMVACDRHCMVVEN